MSKTGEEMILAKKWILVVGTCAALTGCDGSRDAAQESAGKNLALFETSQERCWRYLGKILASRNFRVANACRLVTLQRPVVSSSEAGKGRELEGLWQDEIEAVQTLVGEALGEQYGEMIELFNSDDKRLSNLTNNILTKESGENYEKACNDAVGSAVRSSVKNIKKAACNRGVVESFCLTNSHAFFNLNEKTDKKNTIYANMMKNSIFEKHFMAACLLANPDGVNILVEKLAVMEKSAKKKMETEMAAFLEGAKDKTVETLQNPDTWKVVAKVAFTVAVIVLL